MIAVPAHLYRKRTGLFIARIALALLIVACASMCMLSGSPALMSAGLVVQGAMYVHLVELQHSVLHRQVFENEKTNRLIGFLLGLPMLISYSDFQHNHLKHHRHLGTKNNTETFNYRHENLNSVTGFARAVFDYSRLPELVRKMISRQSNIEYRLFAIALAALAFICPTAIVLWLAPLLAAEPIHFLLELPEHFGLPAHTNESVFENTRLWGGSWFARWYTHYTNFHTAHHFAQSMPMDNLPELAKMLDKQIPASSRSPSYPAFWLQVIRSEIRNFES
jgi:fatty acid desaturase